MNEDECVHEGAFSKGASVREVYAVRNTVYIGIINNKLAMRNYPHDLLLKKSCTIFIDILKFCF